MTITQEKDLSVTQGKMKGSVKPAYRTNWGVMYQGDCEEILKCYPVTHRKGKVQLVLTSPPFPLNRKKKYGNFTGEEYLNWLKNLAPLFRDYLTSDGSIVLELGNAWEPGKPVMSTLPLKALMAFMEAAELNLCQEFICYNPARLPTPAQWVTVERIRVKDAFTRVWWMSPVQRPKANNRNILTEYSKSMQDLLRKGTYNSGPRPSGHHIGKKSFLSDNGGAIPPNLLVPHPGCSELTLMEVLPISNTRTNDPYQIYCRQHDIPPHPARMQSELAAFFIEFLTDKNDLVLDPFAGSNTTGFASQELRRRWLSIELDAKYVETSEVRFRSELLTNVLS
ncbi:MAG: DNA methyltransferase [Chloroflexi bacterium RBG_19FT_COMBO_47_15]|nr:MAG: DNA methyltransferase [Chloroflexi bacterium RBG_19FT_COMBO_47_15]